MEPNSPKIPIILDSDPGCDDAVAIMLAAKHPLLDLKALTIVAGNQTLEKTVRNGLNVCSALRLDSLPIAAGMGQPLVRKQVIADQIHGETGLGDLIFGDLSVQLDPRHAVNLIIEILMASDGEIVFVATGPLTNLAMALRLEPKIIPKLKQIVLIGGSYQLGNITPAAEFNIYADPEAAHIVFTSGRPIVMIGLSITERVMATEAALKPIRALDNEVAALLIRIMNFYTKSNQRLYGYQVSPLYDPAAIVYLINPDIFRTKPMYVEIELKSQQSYGRTHCDYYGVLQRPANAQVVTDLDSIKFWDVIYETIKLYG